MFRPTNCYVGLVAPNIIVKSKRAEVRQNHNVELQTFSLVNFGEMYIETTS